MKYQLINPPNPIYNAKKQILVNRGLDVKEIDHYMNLTDLDINSPKCFGEQLLEDAAATLLITINNEEDICIVVDCDCDGYTSSAILINYLYDCYPDYTEKHVHWFMHEGKQHGLEDSVEWIEDVHPSLAIIPDAGSNDITQIKILRDMDIKVIVLDHHEIEGEHPDCYLINSQSPEYPNKELSGAGVVWQFCKYLDLLWGNNYADWYLDLVALGLDGDMMSLRSFETRRLISKGLEPANIHNPFIYGMWQKNMFKLTETPTAWGFTFYVVPFVNAITRSGTQEEKELIFNSMLKFKAFKQILSNKRGHKAGETEQLVEQAIRTCTNVKSRQSRAEEAGIALVEHLIEENNMMDHKVLLFLLEPGQIPAEIRGLIANKIMARYQRPCCMLTKRYGKDIDKVIYEGSARGCDKIGVTEFKDICAATQVCEYTVGHQGAFGLGISEDNLSTFVENTDKQLEHMASEPVYYVDYIWRAQDADAAAIIDIAEMGAYWGKDMDEPLVAIKGIKVTKDNITMMKSNTCKITLPNGIAMIKFRMPDEEYDRLYSEQGFVEIDVVARCNKNEWNGNVSAQLLIEDMEIKGECAFVF